MDRETERVLQAMAHQVLGIAARAEATEIALIALMRELKKTSANAHEQVEFMLAEIDREVAIRRAAQLEAGLDGGDYIGPAAEALQGKIRGLVA